MGKRIRVTKKKEDGSNTFMDKTSEEEKKTENLIVERVVACVAVAIIKQMEPKIREVLESMKSSNATEYGVVESHKTGGSVRRRAKRWTW